MKRILVSSFVTTVLVMMAGVNVRPVHAQSPLCCGYVINTTMLPDTCFPITVETMWGGGFNDMVVINAPGFSLHQFPFPCPPAPLLTGTNAISSAGCCLTWTPTTNNCTGCPEILFAPC